MFRQLLAAISPITSRSPSPDALPIRSPFKRKSRPPPPLDSSSMQSSEPGPRPRKLLSSRVKIRKAIQTPVLAFGWFYGRVESLVSFHNRASSSAASCSLCEKGAPEHHPEPEPEDTPAHSSNLSSLRACALSSICAPSERLLDVPLGKPPHSMVVPLVEEVKELTVLDDGRCQYTLQNILGEGGWSTVYLAQATPHDSSSPFPSYVAVKVIPKEKCKSDPISYQNIVGEFDILAALTDAEKPFLTNLISAFHDKHNCYAVMHLYGQDLHTRFYSVARRMPDHEIRMYAAELLVAIEKLHEVNVIHRDIKPENIFLDAEGHVVLGDFTIAVRPDMSKGQSFKEASISHEDSAIQGTPFRYAPEQLMAKWPCTYKMDIWAFGLILLDLYRGSPQSIFDEDGNDKYSGEVDILTRDLLQDIGIWVEATHAQDLLTKVLQRDPAKRLTIGQIKGHPYFSHFVDWDMVEERAYAPLYLPELPLPSQTAKKYFVPEPLDRASEPLYDFEYPDPTFKYICPANTLSLGGTWDSSSTEESWENAGPSFWANTERREETKLPSPWNEIADAAKESRSASWA
ncbi:kinase-like domain-containing protein [Amylostereum chailletii]|nr:kinase-like domain-containing protein [Amylostereum chailletii]